MEFKSKKIIDILEDEGIHQAYGWFEMYDGGYEIRTVVDREVASVLADKLKLDVCYDDGFWWVDYYLESGTAYKNDNRTQSILNAAKELDDIFLKEKEDE